MEEIDWSHIIHTLKSQKCVLILGPECPVYPSEESAFELMLRHLGNSSEIVPFKHDELLHFKEDKTRLTAYYSLDRFFSALPLSDLYRQIAQIPFHLIISLSPDTQLLRAYKELGFKYSFDYFRKPKEIAADAPPPASSESPLLYNLVGFVGNEGSLVYTYRDMFSFLSELASSHLPNAVERELQNAQHILFIGFSFERWYMKMILHQLNLYQGKIPYAADERMPLAPDTKELYAHLFKINFIPHKIGHFIQKLYVSCESAGMLKKPSEAEKATADIASQTKDLIGKGEIALAIQALSDFLKKAGNEDLMSEVALQSSAYTRLSRRISTNQITLQDSEVRMAQIEQALIDIAEEAKLLSLNQ